MITKRISSPIGPLSITCRKGRITQVGFDQQSNEYTCFIQADEGYLDQERCVIDSAERELNQYFSGDLYAFNVPFFLSGSEFQQKVWNEIINIPYGQTRTYSQIATAIGNPKAARAVGNACSANPVAIIVPCHRVVSRNGIGGYGGGQLAKEYLLALEAKGSPPPSNNLLIEKPI